MTINKNTLISMSILVVIVITIIIGYIAVDNKPAQPMGLADKIVAKTDFITISKST